MEFEQTLSAVVLALMGQTVLVEKFGFKGGRLAQAQGSRPERIREVANPALKRARPDRSRHASPLTQRGCSRSLRTT